MTTDATLFSKLGRIWRHRWIDESEVRRALPEAVMQRLTGRVGASERRHSGEIRICVEACRCRTCGGMPRRASAR
jgi:hypothetical protein